MTPSPHVSNEMVERAARAIDPVAWGWIDRMERENPDHLALAPTKENRLAAARSGVTAALSAMPVQVPEGWKLVPTTLTEEMAWAWENGANGSIDDSLSEYWQPSYADMLAASPAPPTAQE